MNIIIAKQHLLPSVRWFLDQVLALGSYEEIDLLTKNYSSINSLFKQLPQQVRPRNSIHDCFNYQSIERLLIIDEGGTLHKELPSQFSDKTSGVEQTTYGLQQNWRYPVVLVCRSAAKLIFESQIIARGIIRKLNSIYALDNHIIGIIGLGALGSAVARCLKLKGIRTIATEALAAPDDLQDILVELPELLCKADIILGCTGIDVLAKANLENISGNKIFASCSSADIEFNTLLSLLKTPTQFATVKGVIGRMECSLLNGGYPINFDRETEWELFDEIILTRRLMLEGVLQAQTLFGTKASGVMLNPIVQRKVVQDWLSLVPDSESLFIPNYLTDDFFRQHSEGEFQIKDKPTYTLHTTTPDALTKMRSHTKQYEISVLGLPIIVLPNVWSPAYDWSSLFYVENIPNLKGLDFLEIGCGTGVISVFAGRAGAKRVVAVDVNPEAVRNTRLNFDRFDIKVGETFLSDGFSNVKGKFDLITWNAPYHGCKPADVLERGCADEDYHDIRLFFSHVRFYLNPGGRVIFGFSESGDLLLIESLINDNGFRIKKKLSDWRQDYNCMLFELVQSKNKS